MENKGKILLKVGIEENVYNNQDRAEILYNHPDNNIRSYKRKNLFGDIEAFNNTFGLDEYPVIAKKKTHTTRLESDKKREPKVKPQKIVTNLIKTSEKIDYINTKRNSNLPDFNVSIEVQSPITKAKQTRKKSYEEIAEIFYPNMGEEKSQIKFTPQKKYYQQSPKNEDTVNSKIFIETEENNYDVFNNVKYPINSDDQTVETIKVQAQKELSDIEKERLLEHLKNIAGATLEIGSAFVPVAQEVKIVGAISKVLSPKFGHLIANEITKGSIRGVTSGAVFGLGEGLLQDDSLFKSTVKGATLGFVMGVGFGYALGEIGKAVSKQNIMNASDKRALLEEYYKKYVEGLSNKTEDLHKYRALVNNVDNVGKNEVLYDKINRTGLKPIFIEKEEYANLLSELNTNLPASMKNKKIITWRVGSYQYKIINNGFNEYIITERIIIE